MRISMPVFFVDGGVPGSRTGKGWIADFDMKETTDAEAPVVVTWQHSKETLSYRAFDGRLWCRRTIGNGVIMKPNDLHKDGRDAIDSAYRPGGWRSFFGDHPLPGRTNGVSEIRVLPFEADDPRFAQAIAEMQARVDATMVVDGEVWEHSTGPLLMASPVRPRITEDPSTEIIDLNFRPHLPIRPQANISSVLTLATTAQTAAQSISAFEHEASVDAFKSVFKKVRLKGHPPLVLSHDGWSIPDTRTHLATTGLRSMVPQALFQVRDAPKGLSSRQVVAAWHKASNEEAFAAAGFDELYDMATALLDHPSIWAVSKAIWSGTAAAHAVKRPGLEDLAAFSLPVL